MSGTRTESFYARNPPTFGAVEAAVVNRGHADHVATKLRPFSATGARAITQCSEEISNLPPSVVPPTVINNTSNQTNNKSSSKMNNHHNDRPYELIPWDAHQASSSGAGSGGGALSSSRSKNPFAKNSVTSHLPHIAKSSTVRRVPLTHLGLSMEVNDVVGVPLHQSTWGARNDERAASLGNFLVKSMNERFPDDDDDDDDEDNNNGDANSRRQGGKKTKKSNNNKALSFAGSGSSCIGRHGSMHLGISTVSSSSDLIQNENDDEEEEQEKNQVDRDGTGLTDVFVEEPNQAQNSLAQAAHRTKSMYLSNLQQQSSCLLKTTATDGNRSEDEDDEEEDDEETIMSDLNQQAMTLAFQQLNDLKATNTVNDDSSATEEKDKKMLFTLFQENLSALLSSMRQQKHQQRKQQQHRSNNNKRATESEAMEDVAPPSSGFESAKDKSGNNNSNNINKTMKTSKASSSSNTRRKSISPEIDREVYELHQKLKPKQHVNTISSGRGFFLNGKQRDELVKSQFLSSSSPTSSLSTRNDSNTTGIQQNNKSSFNRKPVSTTTSTNRRSSSSSSGKTGLDENNSCKYHSDAEAQRAIYRSWKFRDQLHLRHSVKATHLPKSRRTIVNNMNPNSPTNEQMSEVIVGTKPTFL